MKAFLRKMLAAIYAYAQTFSFINRHRLWKLVLIPAIIYLLIYGALLTVIILNTNLLSDPLAHWIHADTLSGPLGNLARGVVSWLVRALVFILYFKLFRYIVLILSSPAIALMAEKTQEILTGVTHPFDRKQFIQDVWRGIRLSIRNLLTEWFITIPLYFLLFIPVVDFFIGIAILLIESYFVGFSMMDYRNEFLRMSGRDSRLLIQRNKSIAIGIGLIFSLFLAIPFLGALVAPMLAVVAAALVMEQKF
ncbi:EI24 domain-containing protein [Xanthocytophaga agilis]|uniref:EI24 domain-containing protein n=1 Tax=Xanthocytophaga agilis TaxID=3048010 RepID=A0AAE3UJT2_9BACT|nr:EI24 domain-containing protein [Xanthocytophaga agilis]MDJ1506477.1 EI24 domain-containing protein [Xanthocytophaga agilis]